MGTKNLYEDGPDPFFFFFKKNQNGPRPSEHPPVRGGKMSKRLGFLRSCGNENGPDSYSQIRLSVS